MWLLAYNVGELTFIWSIPACRPAERSKFPPSFTYWYLVNCTWVTSAQMLQHKFSFQVKWNEYRPGEWGLLEGLPHVHVSTAVVSDDEVKVRISGFSEQLLHVSNQLQHPTSLVFNWREHQKAFNKCVTVSTRMAAAGDDSPLLYRLCLTSLGHLYCQFWFILKEWLAPYGLLQSLITGAGEFMRLAQIPVIKSRTLNM